MNRFGQFFRFTTWGESHGPAIGVTIDGSPAGVELSVEEIQCSLDRRKPGVNPYTSPRKETDRVEILSGIFEGKTTGAPITLLIRNHDADSSKYEAIKNLLRPGHANYTYLQKYGCFDWRGGGRASARETASRVAAAAVARKLLGNIEVQATLVETGEIEEGDSTGGIIEAIATNVPVGLGDPVYGKIEALLAHAMLSINACCGFEMGDGFKAALRKGSENNDCFYNDNGQIRTRTNHCGGVLGGITNGMPLKMRVAFKPTSSILKAQETVDLEGRTATFELPEGSRHDHCLAIRAVPVVEAMLILVLADRILATRTNHVSDHRQQRSFH